MNLHYNDFENSLAFVIDSINQKIKGNTTLKTTGVFVEGEIQDITLKEIGLDTEIYDESKEDKILCVINRFAVKLVGVEEWRMINVVSFHHKNITKSEHQIYLPYDYKIILNEDDSIEIESQYELNTTEKSIQDLLNTCHYHKLIETSYLNQIQVYFNLP